MPSAPEPARLRSTAQELLSERNPPERSPPLTLAAGSAHVWEREQKRWLVVETRPTAGTSWAEAARTTELHLRELSSEAVLMPAGLGLGFRVEDVVLLELSTPAQVAAESLAWWRRRLLPETEIVQRVHDTSSARAVFAARGDIPTSQRERYARESDVHGRIRVEAFELHVTEHCNLRCAHCCNTSPYLPEKTLSPDSIRETLATMAGVLHADVFKIMGGEPLLHPQIVEVLRVVRASGVADVVRLFSNGLLLSKMGDDFWRALDQLTVSSYTSAPMRAAHLALIEEKARAFDVVLNVKPVAHFSQVMHDVRRRDAEAVRKTWEHCWLRHRCLVARDGRFYICTRAAYLEDLHQRVELVDPFPDPARRRAEDSVALDDPDLAENVLALLNRSTPLNSCQFCLGGDGPRERHTQLSREDVRLGRLRRLPLSAE
jgi:organic radical activating enzyme